MMQDVLLVDRFKSIQRFFLPFVGFELLVVTEKMNNY